MKQYLDSEIKFVLENLHPSDVVIELGCGYGRVLQELIPHSSKVIGLDTSQESLNLVPTFLKDSFTTYLIQASAEMIPLKEQTVDKVICIQNGISAFKIDPIHLILESVRITRHGGKCLFSSYSERFWKSRLQWFEMQAREGLLGEIDWDRTKDGIIVCKDGFVASTFSSQDFEELSLQLNLDAKVIEIDESSIFCIITV